MISRGLCLFLLWILCFILVREDAAAQLQPLTVSYAFSDEACASPDSPTHPDGVTVSQFEAMNIGCHAGAGHISRSWTTGSSINPSQYVGFTLIAEEGEMLSFTSMDSLSISALSGNGMRIQPVYIVEDETQVLGDTALAGDFPPPSYAFPIEESFSTDSLEIRIYGYNNTPNGLLTISEISLTFKATNIRVNREEELIPSTFNSLDIYPNPVAAIVTFSFDIPTSGNTRFVIYNLLGQEVGRLVDNWLPAGPHQYTWDTTPNASGLYVYHLRVGNRDLVGKLQVVR